MSLLEILPGDIHLYIFDVLPIIDLVVQMFVCKQTKKMAVQVLRERASLQYFNFCTEAVKLGYLKVLEWLVEVGFKSNKETCKAASKRKDWWLFELSRKACPDHKIGGSIYFVEEANPTRDLKTAIKNGNLELTKELCRTAPYHNQISACRLAAEYDQLEILKWSLEDQDHSIYFKQYDDFSLCSAAARSGDLEILKWCILQGYKYSDDIYTHAVEGNNLLMLEYLLEIGAPSDKSYVASRRAAKNGNIEVLQWLYKNGYPFDEYTTL